MFERERSVEITLILLLARNNVSFNKKIMMQLLEMKPIEVEGKQRLTFIAPSRGLIGFRSLFATLTRGSGMLHRAFQSYGHYKGPLDKVRKGVLISMAGQILVNSCTFSVRQLQPLWQSSQPLAPLDACCP